VRQTGEPILRVAVKSGEPKLRPLTVNDRPPDGGAFQTLATEDSVALSNVKAVDEEPTSDATVAYTGLLACWNGDV
jgi:hypothetical protein